MMRSWLLLLLIGGQGLCCAQDVLLAPAFTHISYSGDGYVDGNGVSLGFRFPIAKSASTIELRPIYTNGEDIILSLNYQRKDRLFGGSFELLRSSPIVENFTLDYGVEAGFYTRWISLYQDWSETVVQRSATLGGQISIRASRSSWVQPFLSLHTFYERSLGIQGEEQVSEVNTGNQLGLSLCLGLIIGPPAPPNGSEP